MLSPGESIERIISRFSFDELKQSVGPDVFSSLEGLVVPGQLKKSLERVCLGLIREDFSHYLSEPRNRLLVHSNM